LAETSGRLPGTNPSGTARSGGRPALTTCLHGLTGITWCTEGTAATPTPATSSIVNTTPQEPRGTRASAVRAASPPGDADEQQFMQRCTTSCSRLPPAGPWLRPSSCLRPATRERPVSATLGAWPHARTAARSFPATSRSVRFARRRSARPQRRRSARNARSARVWAWPSHGVSSSSTVDVSRWRANPGRAAPSRSPSRAPSRLASAPAQRPTHQFIRRPAAGRSRMAARLRPARWVDQGKGDAALEHVDAPDTGEPEVAPSLASQRTFAD
jgi:hypothetical protein